jgi:hypothetical protein
MDEKQLADVTLRIFGNTGVKVKYTSRSLTFFRTQDAIFQGN